MGDIPSHLAQRDLQRAHDPTPALTPVSAQAGSESDAATPSLIVTTAPDQTEASGLSPASELQCDSDAESQSSDDSESSDETFGFGPIHPEPNTQAGTSTALSSAAVRPLLEGWYSDDDSLVSIVICCDKFFPLISRNHKHRTSNSTARSSLEAEYATSDHGGRHGGSDTSSMRSSEAAEVVELSRTK